MSDELEYTFQKTNPAETLDEFGFMIGGKCVRLTQEPVREPSVTPEPMRTPAQRQSVRLTPTVREPDPEPAPVQKAKDPLSDIDLSELERWLSGEPDPEPEPEFNPYPGVPLPVVELDRRPTFVDVVRAEHNKQDVVQRSEPNSFVGFLQRHYADERDRLKAMIDATPDNI